MQLYWKPSKPLWRAMSPKEYALWLKNDKVPANVSFSRTEQFARSFGYAGDTILIKILPTGTKFLDSYKRVLRQNEQAPEDDFLDLPDEVMFDISFKLSEVHSELVEKDPAKMKEQAKQQIYEKLLKTDKALAERWLKAVG